MHHGFGLHPIHRLFHSPRLAIWLWILFWSSWGHAAGWTFVVMGDSRGSGPDSQVNTNLLRELAQAVVRDRPAFVLFPGDLVYSGSLSAFQSWTNAMAPVYEAGIPVYPVIGNHDNADPDAFVQVFGETIPDNGPAGELNRTYSIVHSNALILALDTLVNSGRIHQAWVESTLATNTRPHVFAFGHLPAFKVNHPDGLGDYPGPRDEFWRCLADARTRAYFCAHDHFFDHARVDDGDGNPSNDVHQCIVGTAGAPLRVDGAYDGDNGSWIPRRIYHEQQYGYVTVYVGETDVAVRWKHRTAPGAYSTLFALKAVALVDSVVLRWTDPLACGFLSQTVHLRVHDSHPPADLSDGIEIYQGNRQVFRHEGLTPGRTYYYTAWCSDDGITFLDP